MPHTGNLLKMRTSFDDTVRYQLPVGDELVDMNALLGHTVHFHYKEQINCIICGKKTKTSFKQGFCYRCFKTRPEADDCIYKPELCQAHEGISRDMAWSQQHCLTDHYVYLAVSSGLKVGVTRHTQIPTRWIDQGASRGLVIARTPYRQLAGQIEVALKEHLADKTNWQRMLKNQVDQTTDLYAERGRIKGLLPESLQQYLEDSHQIMELSYPVGRFPEKVKSQTFDKTTDISGKLTGIKGQYLIFDDNRVLNIRKHNGYLVEVDA